MAWSTTPALWSATGRPRLPRQTIIHGGKQSMPFEYNNIKTPFYSETERTFDTPLDLDRQRRHQPDPVLHGLSDGLRGQGQQRLHRRQHRHATSGTTRDQFRFVYKTLSGNGSITASVDSLTRSDAWSKAGVMIRESLEAGSKHVSTVVTPDNSCSQQYRSSHRRRQRQRGLDRHARSRPPTGSGSPARPIPSRRRPPRTARPGPRWAPIRRSRWRPTSTSACA